MRSTNPISPTAVSETDCVPPDAVRQPGKHRWLRAMAALASFAAVLPLSSCFDAQAGITISGEDRVSGNVRITASEEFRPQFEKWSPPADLEDRFSLGTTDPTTGQMEVNFSELHLEELTDALRQLSDDHIDLELDRTGGGQISLSGHADFAHLPGANLNLLVTFPGEVIDTNGTKMAANQVEWQLGSGEDHSVWASSPAGETKRNQFIIFAGIVTAAGVLASVLGALWARRERDVHGA